MSLHEKENLDYDGSDEENDLNDEIMDGNYGQGNFPGAIAPLFTRLPPSSSMPPVVPRCFLTMSSSEREKLFNAPKENRTFVGTGKNSGLETDNDLNDALLYDLSADEVGSPFLTLSTCPFGAVGGPSSPRCVGVIGQAYIGACADEVMAVEADASLPSPYAHNASGAEPLREKEVDPVVEAQFEMHSALGTAEENSSKGNTGRPDGSREGAGHGDAQIIPPSKKGKGVGTKMSAKEKKAGKEKEQVVGPPAATETNFSVRDDIAECLWAAQSTERGPELGQAPTSVVEIYKPNNFNKITHEKMFKHEKAAGLEEPVALHNTDERFVIPEKLEEFTFNQSVRDDIHIVATALAYAAKHIKNKDTLAAVELAVGMCGSIGAKILLKSGDCLRLKESAKMRWIAQRSAGAKTRKSMLGTTNERKELVDGEKTDKALHALSEERPAKRARQEQGAPSVQRDQGKATHSGRGGDFNTKKSAQNF